MGSTTGRLRILGVVALLAILGSFLSNSFAVDDHVDDSVASQPCAETPSPGPASARPTALSAAMHQNTQGNSQGRPAGLSWDTGVYGTTALKPAPSGFSALTAWAVVYPEVGAPANAASVTVQVANFTTYVHLTNGTWVEVQNQARDGVSGGHYIADFSNDDHTPLVQQTRSDGSVSFDGPPSGYNDHFWPSVRGTFKPGTVDGVFAEAKMKTNDPDARLVAQIGADWWRNSTAEFVSDFKNNPPVGGNNFVRLTTRWQTLYYTSLSPHELEVNAPAHLRSTAPSCP